MLVGSVRSCSANKDAAHFDVDVVHNVEVACRVAALPRTRGSGVMYDPPPPLLLQFAVPR